MGSEVLISNGGHGGVLLERSGYRKRKVGVRSQRIGMRVGGHLYLMGLVVSAAGDKVEYYLAKFVVTHLKSV